MGNLYESLGASANKEALHRVLEKAGLESSSGYFCNLVPDLAGSDDYFSFVHCDGAGTKSIVAYLLHKATGNAEVYAGLAQDALVMNLDDVYCVGVPEVIVLSNIVNRNKERFSDDALGVLIRSYALLCDSYQKLGIPISLGGGETADCGDLVNTVVLDAVVAGRLRKTRAVDTKRIQVGDIIVGLSSTGTASYESVENSGIGSNGFTLARHALLSAESVRAYPEIGGDRSERWTGPYSVTDQLPGTKFSVGEALLSPTRTYAPILSTALNELGSDVHGIIHCSGGGQTKVLRFGENKRYVKDSLFTAPPLFQAIQSAGKVSWREMYQVFNMGHRMELYVPESKAARVIEISKSFNVDAKAVGHVEDGRSGNEVIIRSPNGEFSYRLTSDS